MRLIHINLIWNYLMPVPTFAKQPRRLQIIIDACVRDMGFYDRVEELSDEMAKRQTPLAVECLVPHALLREQTHQLDPDPETSPLAKRILARPDLYRLIHIQSNADKRLELAVYDAIVEKFGQSNGMMVSVKDGHLFPYTPGSPLPVEEMRAYYEYLSQHNNGDLQRFYERQAAQTNPPKDGMRRKQTYKNFRDVLQDIYANAGEPPAKGTARARWTFREKLAMEKADAGEVAALQTLLTLAPEYQQTPTVALFVTKDQGVLHATWRLQHHLVGQPNQKPQDQFNEALGTSIDHRLLKDPALLDQLPVLNHNLTYGAVQPKTLHRFLDEVERRPDRLFDLVGELLRDVSIAPAHEASRWAEFVGEQKAAGASTTRRR